MRPARSSPALGPLTGIEAVGYVRVSTERQAGELVTSLADQEKAITTLAQRLGVTVSRWFRDEGASGATVAKRPAFKALLSACETSQRPASPGHVLVLNDSRFGRFDDPDEAAALRFRLRQAGWIVRFAENDDSRDTTTRSVMRAIGSAQASEYRRNLMRNSRRGMRGAASQGFWTREAGFGYRREVVHPPERRRVLEVGVPKANDEKVRLAPHAEEAETVRWMFAEYAAGAATLGTLVRALDQRAPGRAWSRRTVQAILKNPVYLGEVREGTRAAPLDDDDGDRSASSKADAHPAIVSRALFDTVQARLSLNRRQTRAARGQYLLSGLVRCSTCGRAYTGGGGTHWKFYKDSGGTARVPVCAGPIGTVGRAILDAAVLDVLAKEIAKPAIRAAIEKALDQQLGALPGAATSTAAVLHKRRQALERQRDNLVALLADGTLSRAEAGPRLDRVRAELSECETSTQQSKFSIRAATVAQSERDRLLAMATDFPAMARRLSGPALRELVRPWLSDAQFDKRERRLTVWIQRVPQVQGLQLFTAPGLG